MSAQRIKPDSDNDRPSSAQTDVGAIPLLTERLYVATLPPVVDDAAAVAPAGEAERGATEASATPAIAAVAAVVPTDATAGEVWAAETGSAAAPVPATATAAQPVSDIGVVREALLDDLERSLPGQIESMIRREVSNAIDDAVFRVVAETQDALARAIGQVVERAVREELNRLRNEGE